MSFEVTVGENGPAERRLAAELAGIGPGAPKWSHGVALRPRAQFPRRYPQTRTSESLSAF